MCMPVTRTLFRSVFLSLLPLTALAHFQELIPSTDMVYDHHRRQIDFAISFTHPTEQGPVMPMQPPQEIGVLINGNPRLLNDDLEAGSAPHTYHFVYDIDEAGDHVFYLKPTPYWEASEGKMVSHYTKVVIDAFGRSNSWDALVGFPVEIQPLSRPYALWVGNVFQGVVLRHGEPVPFAEVEVAYHNDGSLPIPADTYRLQIVRADANGTFTYGLPKAGWWGFAALITAEEPALNPDGNFVDHEEGGLLWVYARDPRMTP
ncbi:DUF4198 domain-containing protein [Balneatrix alpica]|uniref:DUF4198 domain-containing protein n=1 Tax=Balneatrix alpica TaxID=75684 RepID=A0ABV5Z8Q6_9GAMM|nr:DUF4198 domain-containing protein [Balneatrix alpica]